MGIAYSQLNSKQKEAANHVFGPMLVLAGAGTGKTSVLVHRISRLILAKHARPHEIRAFTFTHKAAREIRARVARSSAGIAAAGLNASTFHGYCYQLLREAGEDFQLVDQFELWAFLRQRVADLPLNRFLRAANPGRFLHDLLKFFDRCSDELVTAESYSKYLALVTSGELAPPRVAKKKQAETMSRDEILERCLEISSIFSVVEALLVQNRLLTFGALVTRAAALLRSDGELLARERASSRFLLVDEFQDSNHAQIELTRVLGGDEQNVFAVGDPDQAIYHFRGASSAAFNEFVNVFEKLERKNLINLAENQRSTQSILDCGFAAVNRNPGLAQEGTRLQFDREKLVSARDHEERMRSTGLLFGPEPVNIVPYSSYQQECSDVAERILELHAQGARWNHCAVLFRSHANAEGLVEELGARSIPFEVQDTDLFESDALRDLAAWLHCVLSRNDDVSLFRLALRAGAGVDLTEMHAKLSAAPRGTKVSSVLENVSGGPELLAVLQAFAEQHGAHELLEIIYAAAEILAISPNAIELSRFVEFAMKWHDGRLGTTRSLAEFLEFLDLFREGGGTLALLPPERPEEEFANLSPPDEYEGRDAVKLLTVHAAKGLEFKNVFVLRLVTQSFPTSYKETLFEFPRELSPGNYRVDKSDEQIHKEEERRLFYVAVTRARDTLTLYGRKRQNKKKDEIPLTYLRELAEDQALKQALLIRDPICAEREAPVVELPAWITISAARVQSTIELSASAIETYATCPLKFALQKRWRLPEEPSAALQYGTAIHSALKDFYDAARHGIHRTADETVEIFRREFELTKIDEELQRTLYERQGEQQLRQFIALRALEAKPQVLSTEKPIRFTIEDVVINGRIDRIDRLEGGGVLVLDYKTGLPKSTMDAVSSIQLGLYGLAAQLEGHSVERLAFYNLEDNTIAEAEQIRREKIYETVGEVAAGIRNGDFYPKAGFHCRNCGYSSLCPATVERVFAPAEKKAASTSV
ncbi:MAG TPA: ATP-dependent DNA helicase [Terriglobales bacterium]|nr:ATP-dependent DNA helicase [Terriglobales bacterium]